MARKVDPTAHVAVGGLGYPYFLDAMLRNTDGQDGSTAGNYFETLSFHFYPVFAGKNSSDEWADNFAAQVKVKKWSFKGSYGSDILMLLGHASSLQSSFIYTCLYHLYGIRCSFKEHFIRTWIWCASKTLLYEDVRLSASQWCLSGTSNNVIPGKKKAIS